MSTTLPPVWFKNIKHRAERQSNNVKDWWNSSRPVGFIRFGLEQPAQRGLNLERVADEETQTAMFSSCLQTEACLDFCQKQWHRHKASVHVHKHIVGTCYAHDVTTELRAAEEHICGRKVETHESMVQRIIADHGSNGANSLDILAEECQPRSLKFHDIKTEEVLGFLQQSRPILVRFRLSDEQRREFSRFYCCNRQGVLEQLSSGEVACSKGSGGHAVIVTGTSSVKCFHGNLGHYKEDIGFGWCSGPWNFPGCRIPTGHSMVCNAILFLCCNKSAGCDDKLKCANQPSNFIWGVPLTCHCKRSIGCHESFECVDEPSNFIRDIHSFCYGEGSFSCDRIFESVNESLDLMRAVHSVCHYKCPAGCDETLEHVDEPSVALVNKILHTCVGNVCAAKNQSQGWNREAQDYHGFPGDRAVMLDIRGMPEECEMKTVGLLLQFPCQMPGHGTRHKIALTLATHHGTQHETALPLALATHMENASRSFCCPLVWDRGFLASKAMLFVRSMIPPKALTHQVEADATGGCTATSALAVVSVTAAQGKNAAPEAPHVTTMEDEDTVAGRSFATLAGVAAGKGVPKAEFIALPPSYASAKGKGADPSVAPWGTTAPAECITLLAPFVDSTGNVSALAHVSSGSLTATADCVAFPTLEVANAQKKNIAPSGPLTTVANEEKKNTATFKLLAASLVAGAVVGQTTVQTESAAPAALEVMQGNNILPIKSLASSGNAAGSQTNVQAQSADPPAPDALAVEEITNASDGTDATTRAKGASGSNHGPLSSAAAAAAAAKSQQRDELNVTVRFMSGDEHVITGCRIGDKMIKMHKAFEKIRPLALAQYKFLYGDCILLDEDALTEELCSGLQVVVHELDTDLSSFECTAYVNSNDHAVQIIKKSKVLKSTCLHADECQMPLAYETIVKKEVIRNDVWAKLKTYFVLKADDNGSQAWHYVCKSGAKHCDRGGCPAKHRCKWLLAQGRAAGRPIDGEVPHQTCAWCHEDACLLMLPEGQVQQRRRRGRLSMQTEA